MNKKRLFTKSILALTVAMASQQAAAAGFQLNSQSATGLGRAFAGDAVIADNASVLSRNAAAMALFDAPALSLGVNVIDTDIKVKDVKYPLAPTGTSDQQIGSTSYVPNIYYIHPINDKFTVGAGLYSNFGTKTEFSSDFPANEYGGLTDVKSINFALSVAYRINEQFSVGGGLDVIYGSGKLERENQKLAPGVKLVEVDADGYALGWNIGGVYELNEDNRFGLSYRYSPDLEADGTIKLKGQQLDGHKLNMPLPDMAEFSGFHKLNDQFAVHYSVQWIKWSEFDKLATTGSPSQTLKEYKWQDGWHYSLGGTYYLNNDWELRAGYMYDTSAQDTKTSISVPDSDRQWLSGGFTYHIDSKSNIDFGVTYLMGKDVSVVENDAVLPINATTRANAWLYGIQYSRSF
ncbi:aromatic hydrocarbon degradation protein [Photobacterium jeanii]|uniref:Aromatic hydrocarbon degradation protein n=1 Tax=Photobacterium jeanii TaxID=858640 RepID=A0A178KN96_9GAMM|nr:outer membrane protein transport protein [Photobacterium jeanii]OAN18576.1 aromatic hydrocarbon degradation protein [Photobacterium jeanii]PST91743.1 aromatic hydrocarbon degradation protein [Photobacterium jeanii]